MRPKPRPKRGRSSETPAGPAPPGDLPRASRDPLRSRVQSLLGFAVKAGRVTPGVELTLQGLARGRVRCVLLATDLAIRRRERVREQARARGVRVIEGWTRAELGGLVGRRPTGAVGVTDASLARGLGLAAAEKGGEGAGRARGNGPALRA